MSSCKDEKENMKLEGFYLFNIKSDNCFRLNTTV